MELLPNFDQFPTPNKPKLEIVTFTQYEAELPVSVAFPPESLDHLLDNPTIVSFITDGHTYWFRQDFSIEECACIALMDYLNLDSAPHSTTTGLPSANKTISG